MGLNFICLVYPSLGYSSTGASCALFLDEAPLSSQDLSLTEGFIAFVNRLLKEGVVGDPFVDQLANGQMKNPISVVATNSAHDVYRPLLDAWLNAELHKDHIIKWAKAYLEKRGKVIDAKKQTQDQTQSAYLEEKFRPVKAGSFVLYQDDPEGVKDTKEYFITLTHPFEMMITPVTEDMWLKRMGKHPTGSKKVGDYPVELMTWWSALHYANKMSVLHRLTPAYDLSAIKEWVGDAESGTLVPKDPLAAEVLLKINAEGGDIYKAEGYRLPTVYEQLYVQSDRGRSKTNFFTGVTEENLDQYAWYSDGLGEVQPVATKTAFNIDGQEFYDFYGGSSVWAHDLAINSDDTLLSGINPLHSDEARAIFGITATNRFVTGGDYGIEAMTKMDWHCVAPTNQGVGVRLVRTLK